MVWILSSGLILHVLVVWVLHGLIPSSTHARLLLRLLLPCTRHARLLNLLSTPSLVLSNLWLTWHNWRSLNNKSRQVLCQHSNIWVLWIPLLGVGKIDHVLLTDIVARFYHFHRHLEVKINLRWSHRIVSWKNVLDWKLLLQLRHRDRTFEYKIVICWLPRKLFKIVKMVKNLQKRSHVTLKVW